MIKSDKNLIVGLDIGTSYVKTIVGSVNEDNEIDFLGVGKTKSLGMKRGVVIDIGSTVESIAKSVESAELVSSEKITSVYATISGNHIQSYAATGRAAISDHKEVSNQDLKAVEEAAKAMNLSNDQEILHVLAKEYEIDGQDGIKVPLGMSGIALDGKYHLVTGAKNARDNIEKCIKKCSISPEKVVLEQLASSISVLTEDEKNLGVCLVDIGGGTTDIAIFSNGAIEYTSSLSLGGDQVTNDLAQALKTSTYNAEELKITHGCINNEILNDDIVEVPGVGDRPPRSVQKHTLVEVMSLRYQEIFDFVNSKILQSGFEEKISAGIVLTGGSSKSDGLIDLAEEVFHKQVRLGVPQHIYGGSEDVVKNPEYAACIGLLLYAKKQNNPLIEPLNENFLSVAKKLLKNFLYN
jgi:cell division protein FtsA